MSAGERSANGWRPIESAPIGKTVLTQHVGDLYPVPAYRLFPGDFWLRETEGPEDTYYPEGRHARLYREPTHWMPLPTGPAPLKTNKNNIVEQELDGQPAPSGDGA